MMRMKFWLMMMRMLLLLLLKQRNRRSSRSHIWILSFLGFGTGFLFRIELFLSLRRRRSCRRRLTRMMMMMMIRRKRRIDFHPHLGVGRRRLLRQLHRFVRAGVASLESRRGVIQSQDVISFAQFFDAAKGSGSSRRGRGCGGGRGAQWSRRRARQRGR